MEIVTCLSRSRAISLETLNANLMSSTEYSGYASLYHIADVHIMYMYEFN